MAEIGLRSIAFIGGGVMGEAMIQGLLRHKTVAPDGVIVSEPNEKRRRGIEQRYSVRTTSDNRGAVQQGDVVVLSIKPQILARILPELKGMLRADQLVLSIIAGGRIATLADGLAHQAIVRAMPNTPAQIGQGLTVWTATANVADPGTEEKLMPSPPPIVESCADLLSAYDVVLCDVWGVVHDGRRAFDGANEALSAFRGRGGTVILVSNAPTPSDNVARVLDEVLGR